MSTDTRRTDWRLSLSTRWFSLTLVFGSEQHQAGQQRLALGAQPQQADAAPARISLTGMQRFNPRGPAPRWPAQERGYRGAEDDDARGWR